MKLVTKADKDEEQALFERVKAKNAAARKAKQPVVAPTAVAITQPVVSPPAPAVAKLEQPSRSRGLALAVEANLRAAKGLAPLPREKHEKLTGLALAIHANVAAAKATAADLKN
jgi:hypothetical protein